MAGILGWLLIGAKQDVAREIEACNTRTALSVSDAEKAAREATERAYDERLAKLAAMADTEARARLSLQAALEAAESRPPVVREIIRRIRDENACLGTAVPDELRRLLD
jgi:hypothetical protein